MTTVPNKTIYFRDGEPESEITEMVPAPTDWDSFLEVMLKSTLANSALAQARQVESVSVAVNTIPNEIINVSRGADVEPLKKAWLHLLLNGLISVELLQAVLQAAQEANLPDHLIAALQPPMPTDQ